MKQKIFNLYNRLKSTFIEELVSYIKEGKIEFSSPIHIDFPHTNEERFEEIVSVEFDPEEHTWYAHNYITDEGLGCEEYWTPLRDMSFDELYSIAERL